MRERTIVAAATPPGTSGIAVIRISGDEAIAIADKCFKGKTSLADAKTHTIHYGTITYGDTSIDTVTAALFKAPNSYTGDDVIEISCHGNLLVVDEIINILISGGASPAQPGEFTKRAFINGKLDLTQVEAVADIIHSVSIPGTHTAARQLIGQFTQRLHAFRQKLLDIASLLELELDFSDEDLEFIDKTTIANNIKEAINYCKELADSYKSAEILRSGYFVAIAGYPNSGKSTLFNTLLNRKRAIVSPIPGTTRDYLEETIYLGGIPVRLIDTAGIRETSDTIEIEGIKFVESILQQANMILVINDITVSPAASDILYNEIINRYPNITVLLLQNKIDVIPQDITDSIETPYSFAISAENNIGLDKLKAYIENEAKGSTDRVNDILINQRHSTLLRKAAASLSNALESINADAENELVSIDIKEAAMHLGEITGETWNEDVLNNIFSRFCIGK